MRTRTILALILLVVFTLTACQSAAPSTQPESPAANPQQNPSANEGAYPAAQESTSTSKSIYPGIKDGETITWEQVLGLTMNGEITKFVQGQDLQVKVTLIDGRTLSSMAAEAEAVANLIKSCGDFCKDVTVQTE